MTVFATTSGQRKPFGTKLTDTSATTLVSGTADITVTIEAIQWSVDTAGSTLSIWWNDGTNDYYMVKGETEGANSRDMISDLGLVLRAGMTLKAQAGTANKIDITVIAIESQRTQ